MSAYHHKAINSWAIEDRPREKLLKKGINSLTDSELIAIILSTGTRNMSALDLARTILMRKGGLEALSKASVSELVQINGIGTAKAISLVAAFELGRRKSQIQKEEVKIQSSESVAAYLSPLLSELEQEVFYVLFLNRNHQIKAEREFFKGGVSATIIDPRIIFREAIHHLSSAIIIAHNHPSGNLHPSKADLDITQKIKAAAAIFDIQLLDHLIISHKGYYSFADHGKI